jgi:hypothetical protein
VQPVDRAVDVVGRFAADHRARIQWTVAPIGDDLGGPAITPADVAEQLPNRPVRARRHH